MYSEISSKKLLAPASVRSLLATDLFENTLTLIIREFPTA